MSTKTVWITGASSGIGREFARRYARLGFRLILTARRRDRLETLAAELRAKHGTLCRIAPADLEQDAQVTALCEALAGERIGLFIKQIIDELRKVVTPTAKELFFWSLGVFIFVVLLMLLVTGMDFGLGKLVLWVFG